MKYFKTVCAILLIIAFATSCKTSKSEMTLEDYAKIEREVNLPDPDINPDLVKRVTEKYGYSFEQYKNFFSKVEKDPALREKLGEMKLNEQKIGK